MTCYRIPGRGPSFHCSHDAVFFPLLGPYRSRTFNVLSATASRMSALSASSSTLSPSRKSMARTVLLSRRVLKSFFGSLIWAPLGNVSLTALLSVSPTQIIPSCDQTGTPIGLEGFFHFTSSIMSGSAFVIKARSCDSVLPRQSPAFLIIASICLEGDFSFWEMLDFELRSFSVVR